QLDQVTGGLPHRLRALGEEQAGLVAQPPARQAPRSDDPGGPCGKRCHPGSHGVRGSLAQAAALCAPPASATACLATETMPANAFSSLTASSARILRSTSMPASFNPWIRRL